VRCVTELVLADYATTERDRIVATLFDWLPIPSISADPARAGWLGAGSPGTGS